MTLEPVGPDGRGAYAYGLAIGFELMFVRIIPNLTVLAFAFMDRPRRGGPRILYWPTVGVFGPLLAGALSLW